MATSSLTTLGGFAFSVNGASTQGPATRKARALMAFLIMHRSTDAARERLLETFWPDADPDRARDSFKTALWSIRRCLREAGIEADEFLLATKSMVRWTADTSVDAIQFAELAKKSDTQACRDALHLYRGDFLEGDYDDWVVTERERLAALYETVLGRMVRSAKDTEAAQQFIARNPYDEDAYATLIDAEFAASRRSSAAAWIERCRKALAEINEKPSPEFEARFGNIVRIEPAIADEVAMPFAGREAELAFLAAKIADAQNTRGSITLLHGEAGIGKSSVLNRAAAIASEKGLRVLTIRCGGETASTFGPWPQVFNDLAAGDFEPFVRAHASDVAAAVASEITGRLNSPFAIIVDDVHELKGEALDIFAAFSKRASMLHAIVCGSRPEGVATFRLALADASYEEVPVGRLDRDNLRWALAQALGSEEPAVLDVLYDRTQGHPLFFTGLLNSLIGNGTLARDGRRWRVIKGIDSQLELPDTVKRFIETRLRARGEIPRSVAGALALEPAATVDDLAAVLHLQEATVLDALDDLLAFGLITQPESGPLFAFAHDLIREVAAAGLNAGRRAVLHRAFARCLQTSSAVERSLRLALHLEAAGEPLSAAQSYLRSAEEALDLNAAQDALQRCDAGIAAAEKLERSAASDALLARLQRTAARAALAMGAVHDAIRRTREAVAFARAAEDERELALAILDMAVIEGAAFQIEEQKTDATEAAQHAKALVDEALEAQALVQQANAARELGLRDEALQACRSAQNLALKCGRSDIALTALEALLRTQITWWLFDDALVTARSGMDSARLAGPLLEASFLRVHCSLWYLIERFPEAQSDALAALRRADEAVGRRYEADTGPLHPVPVIQFGCHYIAAKVALARNDCELALDALRKAAGLTNVAKLPRQSEALALLHIEALLQRNGAGDDEAAGSVAQLLGRSTLAQGTMGWSDCIELAQACVAARLRSPHAEARLRHTLDVLEENAHRALLDTDRAFERLARAASELGEETVANRASSRSRYFRSRRLAAAGSSWGGEVATLR